MWLSGKRKVRKVAKNPISRHQEKPPVYLWQCVVCGGCVYSEDVTERHCGKLTQWVSGIDGRGVDMSSPKIKITVSGCVEMSLEDLQRILGYPDIQQGLICSLHMGYCNSDNLDFTLPDDIEIDMTEE